MEPPQVPVGIQKGNKDDELLGGWASFTKNSFQVPSLKLTAKAPENGWLEDEFPFGFRPIFRGYVYVSFREGT